MPCPGVLTPTLPGLWVLHSVAHSDPETGLQKPQVGVHPGGASQGMRKELLGLTSPILQGALGTKLSFECFLGTFMSHSPELCTGRLDILV